MCARKVPPNKADVDRLPDWLAKRSARPFERAAFELTSHDLVVGPAIGDDGKAALFGGKAPGRPLSVKGLEDLAARYPSANVGIYTGPSKVLVVDIDNPALLRMMLERFGDTPLITRTPGGGAHLWYRSSGERSRNLRQTEGLPVDIKAEGGFVVVPPSVRPTGAHEGKTYEFAAGSWDDLKDLPPIRPGALEGFTPGNGLDPGSDPVPVRNVSVGYRNDMLFRACLQQAPQCDTLEDLIDVARSIVADHFEIAPDQAFLDREIRKTAASAWKYETEGRNWAARRTAVVQLPVTAIAELATSGNALVLLGYLFHFHAGRTEPFALAERAMAVHEAIPGWRDPKRYSRARSVLIEKGFIVCVYKGGSRPGDASLYRFANDLKQRGSETGHNITRTPSPGEAVDERARLERAEPRPVQQRRRNRKGERRGHDDAQADLFGPPGERLRRLARMDAKGTGDMIRARREKRGLDQTALAARMGKARSTIVNIERGKTGPGKDLAQRLVEELDLPV